MSTLCVYHANCNDGVLAAAIVQKRMKEIDKEVEFYPMNYDGDFDALLAKTSSQTNILFVDFSLPRADLLTLATLTNSVTIYDHHAGAVDNLHEIERQDTSICCVFDMKRSGAGITWDEIYPDDKRPAIVDIIEDRDIWKFKNSMTKPITAIIRDGGMDIDRWERFLTLTEDDLHDLVLAGVAVLTHDNLNVETEIEKQMQKPNIIEIDGTPSFHAFNSTTLVSEQLNQLLIHPKYKYNVAVSYRVANGKVYCSARSLDDKSAREVAMHFGGNGHPNAAGFTLDIPTAIDWGFF